MKPGVLIISHGSRDPGWVSLVDEAVSQVKLPAGVPAAASFLELVEGRSIQDGVDALEREGITDIVTIPLFVSSGSTHVDEIAYALGAKAEPGCDTDLEPFRVSARIHYGAPADDDEEIAVMIWDKLRPLSQHPEREAVLLIGHGSVHDGFRQRWEEGAAALARRVQAVSGVAAADYGLLNPDSVREKADYWNRRGYNVLAAPLFLSEGYFTKKVIPSRLRGADCRYSGETLLPHPLLPEWIGKQARARLDELKATR